MATERIYRKNQYTVSCVSEVTSVKEMKGCDAVTCSTSVFYPEGGGQPSDTGTMKLGDKTYNVLSAHDESLEGDVWHYTDAPAGTFSAGDTVTLTIDWDRRFINMQRHLGEHMLSGTFHALFGGVNKGFHMGDEYITIDIDLGGRMLTEEELLQAEKDVNKAVWQDMPVSVNWFDDYESSRVMPVRKAVPHDGRVSVVMVGNLPDPYDCIACCGTHPSSSGQVGLVSIYKCEPNKGMNRVFFDCGRKALERLSSDSRMLSDISRRYSCKTADLPSRLDTEAENISGLKGRLAALASYVSENEKETLLSEISSSDSPVFTYRTDILSTDELLKLGFAVLKETDGKLLIMMQTAQTTCLLFSSGEAKCGRLVKEHAQAYGGRGGGRDDNARALFSNVKDMTDFAEAIREVIK